MKHFLISACFLVFSLAISTDSNAQSFDDYSDFASDPILMDEESKRVFGRFFQNNFLVGTGVFTGDLGAANSAGFMIGMRFVFFFDRIWAIEMGAGYGKHKTLYDENNTNNSGVNLSMNTHLIPFGLGFRFGFDQEALPQGIAAMNPYLAAGGELMFRSERVIGTPTVSGLSSEAQAYATNDIINSTAMGLVLGGGFEFDVYKNQVLLGLDLRYHWIFWNDAGIRMAESNDSNVDSLERNGAFLSILGSFTYNY